MATTGQPYVYTGDDPLNSTDPLGLQQGWWVKGHKVVKAGTRGARFLPGEGERSFKPRGPKGSDPKWGKIKGKAGWLDDHKQVWQEPIAKPSGDDGGPHWDVQTLRRGQWLHTNVGVNGNTIGKSDFMKGASAPQFTPTDGDPETVDPKTGLYNGPFPAEEFNPITGGAGTCPGFAETHENAGPLC